MIEYFVKLYSFNDWANMKVLKCLNDQQIKNEKILTIQSHILAAQYIWLNRIKGLPKSPYKLWHMYSLEELTRMGDEIGSNWLEYIHSQQSFDRILVYDNYVGDHYENKVEHIMMHLVNHSSYHRGQLALLIRQEGFQPVNTDFITYDRVITGQLADE